jgi:hypothetical protein
MNIIIKDKWMLNVPTSYQKFKNYQKIKKHKLWKGKRVTKNEKDLTRIACNFN